MAEIKVEPKRTGLGWLWAIIILALIAAAVWYFTHANRTVPATTPADSTRTSLIDRRLIDPTPIERGWTHRALIHRLPTRSMEVATNG